MIGESQHFIFLPGAGGGGEQDLATFAQGLPFPLQFETLHYPGWQRYVEANFSADALLLELTAEIVKRVPSGPIRLIGLSIGGHLGYAAALRLGQLGREVALFCAIDSFMVTTSSPTAGWQKRALGDALDLLKQGRVREFAVLVRSKAWRGVLRLVGGKLAGVLRRVSGGGKLPSFLGGNPVAEQELSMRLLLREVVPWVASLDRDPVPLEVPSMLLRTEVSSSHDAAWRRRCPGIAIRDIRGKHLTLFEAENLESLREAFVAAAKELTTRI